jgi:hypothetical protein
MEEKAAAVLAPKMEQPHTNGGVDNSMRFSNSDVSLNNVIERNGGHIVLANMDSLFAPF